jgi:hypothetical protein
VARRTAKIGYLADSSPGPAFAEEYRMEPVYATMEKSFPVREKSGEEGAFLLYCGSGAFRPFKTIRTTGANQGVDDRECIQGEQHGPFA